MQFAPMPGLDADLLNALRLLMAGVDITQHETPDMPPALFDALAFAHANDLGQFLGTAENTQALSEHIAGQLAAVTVGLPADFLHWYGL